MVGARGGLSLCMECWCSIGERNGTSQKMLRSGLRARGVR